MRGRLNLQLGLVLKILILLGVLVNGVIVFTVLAPLGEEEPSVPVATLERQLTRLQESLDTSSLPTQEVAEERALALFGLAEATKVTVVNWSSRTVAESLASAGNVTLTRSLVEFRARRADLINFLKQLETPFGENIYISNVETRGTEEDWVVKMTLTQLLASL